MDIVVVGDTGLSGHPVRLLGDLRLTLKPWALVASSKKNRQAKTTLASKSSPFKEAPNYPLRYPKYHLTETITYIEVHWHGPGLRSAKPACPSFFGKPLKGQLLQAMGRQSLRLDLASLFHLGVPRELNVA